MKQCYQCGSKGMKQKKVAFSLYGVGLGMFDAEVCGQCGERVFTEETSMKINAAAKEKGLWGIESRTKVAKSGDGLVIRVNKKLADFLALRKGEEVTLLPEGKDKLIIELH